MTFTEKEKDQYSRLIKLANFDTAGQKALQQAKVAIIGMGGLGSHIALQLAQMGVGMLRIVDRDVVELSNLPRTPLYTYQDIDTPKVDAAATKLRSYNANLQIEPHAVHFSPSNATTIITPDIDVVVDGLDNFNARKTINQTCYDQKIPYVFAGALGYQANLSTYTYQEGTPCYACHFGHIDSERDTCSTVGVHTSLVAITAAIEVSETIRLLLKQTPVLLNKLLFIDLENLTFDHIPIQKSPKCTVCGDKQETAKNATVTVQKYPLCGSNSYIASIDRPINIQLTLNKLLAKKHTVTTIGATALKVIYLGCNITIMQSGTILMREVENEKFLDRVLKTLQPLLS